MTLSRWIGLILILFGFATLFMVLGIAHQSLLLVLASLLFMGFTLVAVILGS